MTLFQTLDVPLTTDSEGIIRIGSTRVRLDTVIHAFTEGYTAEEIASQYPVLDLPRIYAVIAYYLNNQTVVNEYMARRAESSKAIQQEIESRPEYRAFREQILKRRATLKAGNT